MQQHDYFERQRRAQRLLLERGLDWLLLTPSSDLNYLTGVSDGPSERLLALLLPARGPSRLLVPAFEVERLRAVAGAEVMIAWQEADDPYRLLAAELTVAGSDQGVGLGAEAPASLLLRMQQQLPNASFQLADEICAALRVRKSVTELQSLRAAASICDEAMAALRNWPLLGWSERELAWRLEKTLRELGLDSVSFMIVAAGENAARPHHEPSQRRIGRGDALVLDFGGTLAFYQSDITRTFFVGGATDGQRSTYAAVLAANEAALSAVRAGVSAAAVDEAARGSLRQAGLVERFTHRTGHGLGLDVHEPPYIAANNWEALAEGMVFSIEPGVYLPGCYGIRIEDIVVVTATGAERLTGARRNFEAVVIAG